jgi:hypothetical protein
VDSCGLGWSWTCAAPKRLPGFERGLGWAELVRAKRPGGGGGGGGGVAVNDEWGGGDQAQRGREQRDQ